MWCLLLVSGSGVAANMPTFSAPITRIPIGSTNEMFEYAESRVNAFSMYLFCRTNLGSQNLVWEGEYWKRIDAVGGPRDMTLSMEEEMTQATANYLKQRAGELVEFFGVEVALNTDFLYMTSSNDGMSVYFWVVNKFRVRQNSGGGYEATAEAFDMTFEDLSKAGFALRVVIPELKAAVLTGSYTNAFGQVRTITLDTRDNPVNNPGSFYADPRGILCIPEWAIPARGSGNFYEGTIEVFYTEDRAVSQVFDLVTGDQVLGPLTVGIRRTIDGSRLVVAGGTEAIGKSLVIETSNDLKNWSTVTTVTNYPGTIWVPGVLAPSTSVSVKVKSTTSAPAQSGTYFRARGP